MAEEPQHWPTERMIQEGHAEYALPEDLEGLDVGTLEAVAVLCEADEFQPDECLPCLAHTMVLDRVMAERQEQEEQEDDPEPEEIIIDGEHHSLDEPRDTPRLDNLLHMPSAFEPEPEVPVAEVFAEKVEELRLLVSEMLDGPPIPPKNVSLADLALLTLAADKWVKMTEIQGGWGGEQQQMLDATKALVARLRP